MYKTEYDEVKANLIKKSLEKDKTDVFVPVERRKGEDKILNFLNLICFLSWGVVAIIIAIIIKAGDNIGTNYGEVLWRVSRFWDVNLLITALIITIACFTICTICIILNFTRHRRRTDRIKRSLVLCELICFIIGTVLILSLY